MGASLISVLANGAKTSQDVAQQQAQIQGQQQQTANAQITGQGQQIQNQNEVLKQQEYQRQLNDEESYRKLFAAAGQSALGGGQSAAPQIGPNGQPQAAASSVPQNLLSDPRAAASWFARNGGSGKGTMALLSGLTTQNLELQKLTKGELENHLEHTKIAAGLLEGIANSTPDVRAQSYPAAYAEAVAHAPSLAKFLPAPTPGTAPTEEQLAPAIGFVGLTGNLAKLHQTNAETEKAKQDALKATADAANAAAKTPGEVADSTRKQLVTQSMQDALSNPQQGLDLIDKAIPAKVDGQANSSFKAAYQAAMQAGNVDGANKIVEAAASHAASISKALNPDIQRQEVQKAVNIEAATSGMKVQQAVATARAIRAGDNPAVANVAPAAVGQVQNQAIKLDEEQLKANAAAESISKVLALAGSGNKAAGANVPLMGVGAVNAINGIKRINSAEIAQYGSAGSLLDQIQGKIGKLAEGKPIPPDVLKDMQELHQVLAEGSYKHYTDSIDALNSRSGAQYKPTVAPPVAHAQTSLSTGHKIGDVVDVGGGQKITITKVLPGDKFTGTPVQQ